MLLVVHGVAGAGGQGEAVAQMPVHLAVARRKRRVEVGTEGQRRGVPRQRQAEKRSDRPVVVDAAQEGRSENAERAVRRRIEQEGLRTQREEPDAEQALVGQRVHVAQAPFAEGIGAGHPACALVRAVKLELLRPPLGLEGAGGRGERDRRTVDVRVAHRVEVPPTADRLEAQTAVRHLVHVKRVTALAIAGQRSGLGGDPVDVFRIRVPVEPVDRSESAVGGHVAGLEVEVAVRVVVRAVRPDREGQRLGGQEGQAAAPGGAVEVVAPSAQEVVVRGVLDRRTAGRKPSPDLLRHWSRQRQAVALALGGLACFEFGDGAEQPAMELALRRPRDDVDRAGGRVATPQRALGPAQDLDPLQVEERIRRRLGPGHVDPVHVVADRRLGAQAQNAGADAADRQGDFAGRRRLRRGDDARRRLGQGLHVADRLDVQFFSGAGNDRDRHVLDGLLDLLRGHRDLVGDGRFRVVRSLTGRRKCCEESRRKDEGEAGGCGGDGEHEGHLVTKL